MSDVPSPSAPRGPEDPVGARRAGPSLRLPAWPLTGALLISIGVGAFLWTRAARDPRVALVDAVGERRFFDARLTGGFKFGDAVRQTRGGAGASDFDKSDSAPPMRGPSGPAAEDWEILAAAARIKKEIGTGGNPKDRSTLAAAHLVLGETDEAVRLLERALRDPEDAEGTEGAEAGLLSDLAAAYLTRASTEGRADDFPRAIESAAHAVEIEPTLREALYNKALALESLYLPTQAIKAWDAFLANEPDAGWRQEAARRRGALVSRKAPDFARMRRDIEGALERGTDEELAAAVRANVGMARDIFELRLLPNGQADRKIATRLARQVANVTGDPYQVSSLLSVDRPGGVRRAKLFAEGRRLYDQGQRGTAAPMFEQVIAMGPAGDPLSLWSRLFLAAAAQDADLDKAADLIAPVIKESRKLGYFLLLGRALWLSGTIETSRSRHDAALLYLGEAREVLAHAGEPAYAEYLQIMRAEALSFLGSEVEASAARVSALRGRSLLREPIRQVGVVMTAALEHLDRKEGRAAASLLAEIGPLMPTVSPAERIEWALWSARAAELATPGSGLTHLRNIEPLVRQLGDPTRIERMRMEIAITRGELSTEASPEASYRLAEAGIEAAREWRADFRLPGLYDRAAHLLLRDGRAAEGIAKLREGIAIATRQAKSGDPDLALSAVCANLTLYGRLVDVLIRNGASPDESLATAEQAFELVLPRGPAGPIPMAALRASVPPQAAVVAFLETPNGIVGWVLTRQEVSVHRLTTLSGRAAVFSALSSWRQAGESDASPEVDLISSLLLRPLASRLAGVSRVAVVAVGPLGNIPFAALRLEPTSPPFAARVRLSLAPSLAFATDTRSFVRPGSSLIVADPDTDGRMPRLPSALAEGATVAGLYPKPLLLSADQARVGTWLQAGRRAEALYFATHANLNLSRPSRSNIPMAGHESLTVAQIASQDLRKVSLAMLAACGSSRWTDGSAGYSSISVAFLRAGVAATVGSLSDVSDTRDFSAFVELAREVQRGVPVSEAYRALMAAKPIGKESLSLVLLAPLSM